MFAICLAMVEPEDHDAFTVFFDRYYKLVLYQTTEILKNREAAEDVTQEIFLYAAEHFEKFRGRTEREHRHYLMICARCRAISALHEQSAPAEAPGEEAAETEFADGAEQIVLRRDTAARLLRAIDEMDEGFRAPLKLRMAGADYEEIADVLHLTRSAAYQRVRRGYQILRERMAREDEA